MFRWTCYRDLAVVDITYEVAQFTKWATESPPRSSGDSTQLLRKRRSSLR